MTKFAVCIRTGANSFALWIVTEAETARDAVEKVRSEYTVHDVVGVFKEVEAWKYD